MQKQAPLFQKLPESTYPLYSLTINISSPNIFLGVIGSNVSIVLDQRDQIIIEGKEQSLEDLFQYFYNHIGITVSIEEKEDYRVFRFLIESKMGKIDGY